MQIPEAYLLKEIQKMSMSTREAVSRRKDTRKERRKERLALTEWIKRFKHAQIFPDQDEINYHQSLSNVMS